MHAVHVPVQHEGQHVHTLEACASRDRSIAQRRAHPVARRGGRLARALRTQSTAQLQSYDQAQRLLGANYEEKKRRVICIVTFDVLHFAA